MVVFGQKWVCSCKVGNRENVVVFRQVVVLGQSGSIIRAKMANGAQMLYSNVFVFGQKVVVFISGYSCKSGCVWPKWF